LYWATFLGLITVARQCLEVPPGRMLLALAGTIVWMWWLQAWLKRDETARNENSPVALCVIVAFAVDVAIHNALHGLDVLALAGAWPVIAVSGVAAVFGISSYLAEGKLTGRSGRDFVLRRGSETAPVTLSGFPLAWSVWAPFCFLEMSLLANAGRVQVLGGIDLLPATLLILGGLCLGALLPRWMAWLCPLAVGLLLWSGGTNTEQKLLLLVVAQAGAVAGLVAGLERPARGRNGWVWMAGPVAFFGLSFLFYCPPNYSWPPLWLIAAIFLAVAAWPQRVGRPVGGACPVWPALACFLVVFDGVIGCSLFAEDAPANMAARPVPLQEPARLRVLTYNIHHGFDAHGMPAAEEQARYIERLEADLVALQEVGRGDSDNGGVDLVAYLKWRLPQYEVIFGSTSDELSGNVVLSRLPVQDSGVRLFPQRGDRLRRGLVWVEVPTTEGRLRFASTHLTVYSPAGREAQAGDLLDFWERRPFTIIAGDMNAGPEQPPMQRMREAGLVDVIEASAGVEQATSPALNPRTRIDYVWASPDLGAKTARIPRVTFSDHLPVETELQLRLPLRTGIA
jgi:endonuclease/exonuclease/phosphatase family metal-dependent hydrolase